MTFKSAFLALAVAWVLCVVSASRPALADCPSPTRYGCKDYSTTAAPPGNLDGVSPLRRSIIDKASSQLGQVSAIQGADGNKCGWERLTSFYNTSYDNALRNSDYEKMRRPMSVTTVSDLEHPGEYKAVLDNPKMNDWCGIFALWAVKSGAKSFVPASVSDSCSPPANIDGGNVDAIAATAIQASGWRAQTHGWGVDGLPYVAGTAGIQPGDIVYFRSANQHQAIVERVVNGKIYTIDGNQECQQIGRNVSDLRSVVGYNRVE